jgi:hypothetical protein
MIRIKSDTVASVNLSFKYTGTIINSSLNSGHDVEARNELTFTTIHEIERVTSEIV